jgi:alkanesulfonate monooxygenase SsuD/methylene tetrahydromethanopterin reductase-like flavin-dependent oxidoreductase (luciferase family)
VSTDRAAVTNTMTSTATRTVINTRSPDWGLPEGRLSLGISLGGPSNPAEWQRALGWVDRAEALGLHSVWIPEMHFAPGVASSPLLILAACAARTRKLRLGTTSLLLPIRPPLRVAEEVAALDQLSGGRVLLGLGRGFRAPLFAAFGIDAATKRDRFDAALDLMLARWAGRPVDLAGTPFEGEHAAVSPADPNGAIPHQHPHPPLAVAAFGRKGLMQASRRGLPYLASPLEPLDLIAENLAFHRENLPDEVDPEGLVVPIMRTVHVAGSDEEAARVHAGLEREMRATRSGARVPAAIARAAEAGVEDRAVVGTRNEVKDRLARYRERLGMDLLVVRPQVGAASQAEREAALERLAGEVLPALGRQHA